MALKKLVLACLVPGIILFSTPALAQNDADVSDEKSPLEIRNAVGTILISGLVGGIIGLSTLSFYPKPQDNIRNIFFGAGVGMIVATLWMTFNVATQPVDKQIRGAYQLVPKEGVTFAPYVDHTQGGLLMSYRF